MHTVWRNVTPTFVWKALHGEALPVENGGVASRDFIYVEDIARGLTACALKGKPGEAYNIGSGVEITIRDLAERINVATGNSTPIALAPARDWDRSGQRFAATEKARETIGFVAQIGARGGYPADRGMDASEPDDDFTMHDEPRRPRSRGA